MFIPQLQEVGLLATEVNGIHIPTTYKQAISDPQYSEDWKAVIQEELTLLQANETQVKEVPPEGVNLVSAKQVFTIKVKLSGEIERFKARLVARGFNQVLGEDYFETFSLIVRMDTLRIFLATVAALDLEYY